MPQRPPASMSTMAETAALRPARDDVPAWNLLIVPLAAVVVWNAWRFTSADVDPLFGDPIMHTLGSLHVYARLCASRSLLDYVGMLGVKGPFYPPLAYLVTAPFYATLGVRPQVACISAIVFTLILLLSAWALGRHLWGPKAGLVAGLLAVGCPAMANFSTTYCLDMPQAAMIMLVLALLYASDFFRRPLVSLAVGVAMGLGLITKHYFWVWALPAWTVFALIPTLSGVRSWGARLLMGTVGAGGLLGVAFLLHTWLVRTSVPLPRGYVLFWMLVGAADWWLLLTAALLLLRILRRVEAIHCRTELARLGSCAVSGMIALAIASQWFAVNYGECYRNAGTQMMPDFLQHVAGLRGHMIPGPLGLPALHAGAYAAELVHLVVSLPVFVAFLIVLGLHFRRCVRGDLLPLILTLVVPGLLFAVFPVFRMTYAFPAGPIIGVLAAALATVRRPVGPLASALLVGVAAVQLLGWQLPLRPALQAMERCGLVVFFNGQADYQEQWVWQPVLLPIHVPIQGPSQLQHLFTDLASRGADRLPALFFVSRQTGTIRFLAKASALDADTWFATEDKPDEAWNEVVPPGQRAVRQGGLQTFRTVVLDDHCVWNPATRTVTCAAPWSRFSHHLGCSLRRVRDYPAAEGEATGAGGAGRQGTLTLYEAVPGAGSKSTALSSASPARVVAQWSRHQHAARIFAHASRRQHAGAL